MIMAFVIAVAVFVLVQVGRVLLMMARWSAPLSTAVGLLIAWGGMSLGSIRAFGFGLGLFAFSILLFVISERMRGR